MSKNILVKFAGHKIRKEFKILIDKIRKEEKKIYFIHTLRSYSDYIPDYFKRERIDSSMIEEVILELDMLYDVYYVEDDDTIIIYDDVDYLNANEDF